MKVTSRVLPPPPPEFTPREVTLTLETAQEAQALFSMFNNILYELAGFTGADGDRVRRAINIQNNSDAYSRYMNVVIHTVRNWQHY